MKQLPPRIKELEVTIAKAAGLKVKELRKEMRDRSLVNARAMIWFVAHDLMGYTSVTLARLFDRDHTTILHHVNRLRGTEEAERVTAWLREKHGYLVTKEGEKPAFVDEWNM